MSDDKEKIVPDLVDKATGLTPKEQHFLDVLFDKFRGNVRAALNDAGYPKDMPTSKVTHKLKDKIVEASKLHLAISTGRAAAELVQVLEDPTALGNGNILKAAKEILDRSGVVTKEEAKVVEKNIFILPPKDYSDAEEKD